MLYIYVAALGGLFLFGFCFTRAASGLVREQTRTVSARRAVPLLIITALLVRLFAACLSRGFDTDINCFASWADRIYRLGPGGFYSPDVFTDYPPGYMYLLWGIGALRDLLGIEYGALPHLILLKLPSILCDLGCGFIVYRETRKKYSHSRAFFLSAAYLFNPAVILNSAVWGQVDSVFTLVLACMCLSLVKERLVPAYVCFFAALFIKPQALFLAPVLLFAVLDQIILKDFGVVNLLRHFAYGILVLCAAALLCAPFGLSNVLAQYTSTVASYPYAAVNAYNLWGFLGLNWIGQTQTFMSLPYYIYGYGAVLLSVAFAAIFSLKKRSDREKYPLLGAFLTVSFFVFSVRMHERYLYPAMLFLLLAYLYRPSRKLAVCYTGFSLLHFCNVAHVLYFYNPHSYDRTAPAILLISLGMLALTVYFYRYFFRLCGEPAGRGQADDESPLPAFLMRRALPKPRPSLPARRLKAAEWVCMLAITVLYACFALHDLGDRVSPVTTYDMEQGQSLVLDFGEGTPRALSYYIAPWHHRVFTLEGRRAPEDEWVHLGEVTLENVFTWQELSIEAGVPHLRLTLEDTQASLTELVFLDVDGNVVTPVNAGDYAALFDEQALHPEYSSFRNSMYFDEVYHARSAYEFLNGLYTYENTHPPLGKIFISAGIFVFGMNPFGWRIMGVLFGIAMVPLVYLFARRITPDIALATLACILFTFDFMHFTQTRIATIDVYITFFVILMYFMMYRYYTESYYDTPLGKTLLPLGACGLSMGLGIAAKWTGVYAGAGLAVLFFSILYRRYREYLWAKAAMRPESPHETEARRVAERFRPYTGATVLFCIGFFVLLPAVIYLLSYLPFRDYTDDGLFLRMLHNQISMFRYHSTLDATHSYSSPWYQWPIIARPVWYFSGKPGGDLREGISAFGNPLVWWAGIPAFFYTARRAVTKRDRRAAFLTVGYLAQYLPWVLVTRITFIYHYFPSVAFVVLMIAYSLSKWKKSVSPKKFYLSIALYGAAVFGLFLLFYPVLSGQPVNAAFVDKWLRWFDSWVLVAR